MRKVTLRLYFILTFKDVVEGGHQKWARYACLCGPINKLLGIKNLLGVLIYYPQGIFHFIDCFLRKYEYPRKPPPSFYQVTNNSKERPDVWVDSPEKLVFLFCLVQDIFIFNINIVSYPLLFFLAADQ